MVPSDSTIRGMKMVTISSPAGEAALLRPIIQLGVSRCSRMSESRGMQMENVSDATNALAMTAAILRHLALMLLTGPDPVAGLPAARRRSWRGNPSGGQRVSMPGGAVW